MYAADQLIAAGGQLWEKAGMSRVYFNDIEALYGLEVGRYNTGNICGATLDGQKISNSQAAKIIQNLPEKVWYDLTDGKFHCKGSYYGRTTDADFRKIVDAIKAKIA